MTHKEALGLTYPTQIKYVVSGAVVIVLVKGYDSFDGSFRDGTVIASGSSYYPLKYHSGSWNLSSAEEA